MTDSILKRIDSRYVVRKLVIVTPVPRPVDQIHDGHNFRERCADFESVIERQTEALLASDSNLEVRSTLVRGPRVDLLDEVPEAVLDEPFLGRPMQRILTGGNDVEIVARPVEIDHGVKCALAWLASGHYVRALQQTTNGIAPFLDTLDGLGVGVVRKFLCTMSTGHFVVGEVRSKLFVDVLQEDRLGLGNRVVYVDKYLHAIQSISLLG